VPPLSTAMQNAAVGQDSPVNFPVPASTMAGGLQVLLLSVTAWPERSSATHVVSVAQEIATSLPEGSVNAFRQPAGGVDDSTVPLLSVAKHAAVLGQETPVITALSRSGCTAMGAVQPGCRADWDGVTDGAGDVDPAEEAGLAGPVDPVWAAGAAGPPGAVSRAA